MPIFRASNSCFSTLKSGSRASNSWMKADRPTLREATATPAAEKSAYCPRRYSSNNTLQCESYRDQVQKSGEKSLDDTTVLELRGSSRDASVALLKPRHKRPISFDHRSTKALHRLFCSAACRS